MPHTTLLQQLFAHEQVFMLPTPAVPEEPKTVQPLAEPSPENHVNTVETAEAAAPTATPEPSSEKTTPPALVAEGPAVAEPAAALPPPRPGQLQLSHRVLLLVDGPTGEELALLEQILQAVGYTRDNTDLLDVATLRGQPLKAGLLEKSVHHFISFGVPLKRIGLQIFLMPYQPRAVENIQFMLSHPLAELQADKAKKKALWQGLRAMFGV